MVAKHRQDVRTAAGCALLLATALLPALAQTAEQPPPAGRTATGAGVTQLPQTAPPTGIQAPLPKAAVPPRPPDRPLLASPTLKDIQGRLASQPLTIDDAVALGLGLNRSLALAHEAPT